jgi:thioredoxin 1
VIAVDDALFETEVLASERPVVLLFTAPWCHPCKKIEPILAALAEEHGLLFAELDVDANLRTPSRYGVLSLPTTTLFVAGEPVATVAGAQRRERFERAFLPLLPP